MNELSLPYHGALLSSDHHAHKSQIQRLSPWIILDKHNSYPLISTFKDYKQAILYGTTDQLSKSHYAHMSLKL